MKSHQGLTMYIYICNEYETSNGTILWLRMRPRPNEYTRITEPLDIHIFI